MLQFNSPNLSVFRRADATWSGLGALWRRLIPLARRHNGDHALQHLESLPLTAQSSLALVRLHDETLLLGITPHNVTLLTKTQDRSSRDAGVDSISTSAHEQGSAI